MARSKQSDLPGIESSARKIAEIHDIAEQYADARDERQALTQKEVELKGELLKAMKRHKKTEYSFGDVEVRIVVEEESIKVRIRKHSEEDADE